MLLGLVLYSIWDNSPPKELEMKVLEKIPHEELGQLFAGTDSNTFRLLILPFKADKYCRIEGTEYQQRFIDRFTEIIIRDSLNIEMRFEKNTPCLSGFAQAELITNDPKIDMVIWGRYWMNAIRNHNYV